MPQDTFYNLDEEKQKRITAAAVTEFAQKGYQGANIQNIAGSAEVAKGSMYQYFESKKALFFYILDLAVQQKIQLVKGFMQDHSQMSFFDLMEAMFSIGIRFAVENPELYRIYQDIQQGAPVSIRKEFEETMGSMGQHHYRLLMRQAMAKGEIREDLSEDLAAFVIYTLLKNFADFFIEKGGLDSVETQEKYVKNFVDILKNGVRA